MCGGGSDFVDNSLSVPFGTAMCRRRQDHLGEGPTEEVPPGGEAIRRHRSIPRQPRADYEVVKVAAHLEPTRLSIPPTFTGSKPAVRNDRSTPSLARSSSVA